MSEKIHNIVKQFLCSVPIKDFQWGDIHQHLTYDLQEILVRETVNNHLILNHPIQTKYQKAFLKYLISNLEKQESDIHDDLYSAYGRLVALPAQDEQYFKHYYIEKSGVVVSLKENVNLISDGTTGLRTWQASLAVSEWILQNCNALKNKVILELGSGVGLTGLTIAMECSPSCLFFTDCHPAVLKILCDNIAMNLENIPVHIKSHDMLDISDRFKAIQERCVYSNTSKTNIFVLNLPWEVVNEEECLKLGPINKVIAADVVYDTDLFEPLIKALRCLAKFCGVEEFIFSCTERNRNTLEEFKKQIAETSFVMEELEAPSQKNFIWPTDIPIRIFRFTPG